MTTIVIVLRYYLGARLLVINNAIDAGLNLMQLYCNVIKNFKMKLNFDDFFQIIMF